MLNLFRSKNPSCGLDLGSTWCKTVKLAPSGKTLNLQCVVRIPWSEGEPGDPGRKSKKLQDLWNHLGLKDKAVASSLAGHGIIVKKVQFRPGRGKDIKQEALSKADQYIPYDLNDVCLDCHIPDQSSENQEQDIVLVAGKKVLVLELMKIIKHSGLKLSIVDVDAFALSNCFEYNYPDLTQEPVYLLDIGGQQSIFAVFLSSHPLFFREAPLGGRQLTEIIAKHLKVSPCEAEKIKLAGPENQDPETIQNIYRDCRNLLRSWASDIKRLMGLYRSSVPGARQAELLFLSGGGSLFKGLEQVLEHELQVRIRHLDPWKKIQVRANDFDLKYLESVRPQFAVSTGLALRGFI